MGLGCPVKESDNFELGATANDVHNHTCLSAATQPVHDGTPRHQPRKDLHLSNRTVDDSQRSRYCWLALLLMPRRLLATATVFLLYSSALAGPLDDAHVADIGFSGPTSEDLTAVHWNPAGLGLLHGPQLMLGGAWQMTSVSVDRASIDPATGTSPGTTAFPSASGSGTLHPFRWPLGPSGFFGLGAGIGRRFGIAVALYSPFSSKLTMKPTDDGQEPPTRYHLVSMEMHHIALTTGIAIHVSDSIQIGVAPGLLFPTGRLMFDQDTGIGDVGTGDPSLGTENPALAARYTLATRGILVPSYFLTAGILYRRDRLSFGLAYTTGPLGNNTSITLPLDNTQISFPGNPAGGPELCSDSSSKTCLVSQMRYRLPSSFTAGVTWWATKNWSTTGIVRYVQNSVQDKVTILVTGPASQSVLGTSVPDHIVFYRGMRNSVDVRARVVYETKQFRLGGTMRLETSAVPASHVSAAAIDGFKLEPSLAAEMRIWRQIRLSAGYAFTYMFPVDTGTSVYDPTAASTCTAVQGDLKNPACQARLNGQAHPTAAGKYHFWRQTLSVFTTFGF
jgi:long-subunit fatty acid transport protein